MPDVSQSAPSAARESVSQRGSEITIADLGTLAGYADTDRRSGCCKCGVKVRSIDR